jgi:hypothetical protein
MKLSYLKEDKADDVWLKGMWFSWSDTCGKEPSRPTTHRMQQVDGFQYAAAPSHKLGKSKTLFTNCVYPIPDQSRRVIQSTSHFQFRYGSERPFPQSLQEIKKESQT